MKYLFRFIIFITILFYGCSRRFPEKINIARNSFVLLNQDSSNVNFPFDYKGKILVATFIYTNCPDICPMTTYNMQQVQKELKQKNINNVQFAAISFDPIRDTPSILKDYASIRGMNLNNFSFLTGNKKSIYSLIKNFNFLVLPGDTTQVGTNPVYFFTHADKIYLIDQQGRIRNEYRGSKLDKNKLLSDIKYLED